MKRFIACILTAALVLSLAACGGSSTDGADAEAEDAVSVSTTKGGKLADVFLKEIEKETDLEKVANKLAKKSDVDCVVMEVEQGYLNGFSDEIYGFDKGYMFSPMIGSIPMVGYVFEAEDAEVFKNTLTSMADLDFNICTHADEMVTKVSGNYVFFVMCSNE